MRGVSGDGNAPLVLRRRPQLSCQSLPCLRRLLHRLPVLAAARIQRQCPADARDRARRILCRLCLAARLLRPLRPQWPRHQSDRSRRRRGVHLRFCRLQRPASPVRRPHRTRRILSTDAAQCDGGAVRRRVALRDRGAGDGRARILARHRRADRHAHRPGLAVAGDQGCRRAALSRRRRRRLRQRRRAADRPAQALSSFDVLRLCPVLCRDLRRDALSLPAGTRSAVSMVGFAGRCSARWAGSAW